MPNTQQKLSTINAFLTRIKTNNPHEPFTYSISTDHHRIEQQINKIKLEEQKLDELCNKFLYKYHLFWGFNHDKQP